MWRNTPVVHKTDDDARPQTTDADTATADEEAEARMFYERLEQTGRLVDVTNNTDVATLDPRITHIRRPDGSIERIGFA